MMVCIGDRLDVKDDNGFACSHNIGLISGRLFSL
jgi:hypothetical protein